MSISIGSIISAKTTQIVEIVVGSDLTIITRGPVISPPSGGRLLVDLGWFATGRSNANAIYLIREFLWIVCRLLKYVRRSFLGWRGVSIAPVEIVC